MKAAAVVPKHLPMLALRDEVTGQQVEIPIDAKGKPDFLAASLALRKLRAESAKKVPTPAPALDPKLKTAQLGLKSAKADCQKAYQGYQAAAASYDKAKQATLKAKQAQAKPAVIAKLEGAEAKAKEKCDTAGTRLAVYRKGLDFSRQAYEKLKKAQHKAPAYDYTTASWNAFGKKYPKQFGAPRIVVAPPQPKPVSTVAAAPHGTKAPNKVPAKAPAAVKPVTKTPVPAAAPKPVTAPVITPKPPAAPTPSAAPKPVAKAAPSPPPPPIVEAPKNPEPVATAQPTVTPDPAATNSAPVALSGVSDAEAADYTVPVTGYPTEKAPIYVWKHKSEKKYLAVGSGKRVLLNEAQFLSLDTRAHPEFYAKVPKPLPKGPPAPKTANDPDF